MKMKTNHLKTKQLYDLSSFFLVLFPLFLLFFFRTLRAYAASAILIASSADAFAPFAFHRTPGLLRSTVVPRANGGLKLLMNVRATPQAQLLAIIYPLLNY